MTESIRQKRCILYSPSGNDARHCFSQRSSSCCLNRNQERIFFLISGHDFSDIQVCTLTSQNSKKIFAASKRNLLRFCCHCFTRWSELAVAKPAPRISGINTPTLLFPGCSGWRKHVPVPASKMYQISNKDV